MQKTLRHVKVEAFDSAAVEREGTLNRRQGRCEVAVAVWPPPRRELGWRRADSAQLADRAHPGRRAALWQYAPAEVRRAETIACNAMTRLSA